MATLDKEFAEERCETLELELDGEREKVGGLQDEVLALEEVNAEYEQPPVQGGEKSSVAFVQLEKHNERLKEALIRCVSSLVALSALHHAARALTPESFGCRKAEGHDVRGRARAPRAHLCPGEGPRRDVRPARCVHLALATRA